MLSYSPSNPPPKSRITNKRLAFPLSGDSGSGQNSSATLCAIPSVSKQAEETLENKIVTEEAWNSELRLKEMNENICKILTDKQQKEDILKRLEVMNEMWSSAKLSEDCQKKVWNIVNVLIERDYNKAEQLQLELVMEFGTQCSSWSVAFRHLIQASQG